MNETETVLPPGATMTAGMVRKLKIAIAIMSVLLVVGFILLLVGIYMQTQKLAEKSKATAPSAATTGVSGTIRIPIPPGAEVTQMLIYEGQLILHLRQPHGAEIAVIDLATGREVQRFRLTPQESP